MLTYASLLALVPLLVVVLAVIAALPVFERWAGPVEGFVLQNFVPAAGDVASEYLVDLAGRARDLSLLGVAFLVLAALLLSSSTTRFRRRSPSHWLVFSKRPEGRRRRRQHVPAPSSRDHPRGVSA